jgi:hypothetical protein
MLRWWLVFILLMVVTGLLFYTGLIWIVLAQDITYISVGILAVTIITSGMIGKDLYQHFKDGTPLDFSDYRFVAVQLTVWGLIGTIIGFLFMFYGVDFTKLSQGASFMTLIATKIVQGASTALYTTLFGAVGSSVVLAQLQLLRKIEDGEEG